MLVWLVSSITVIVLMSGSGCMGWEGCRFVISMWVIMACGAVGPGWPRISIGQGGQADIINIIIVSSSYSCYAYLQGCCTTYPR